MINIIYRKDNNGRILKNGETQRKNKTYEYRYKDPATGKRVSIYRNTLQELRDEEKKIQKMLDKQMDTPGQSASQGSTGSLIKNETQFKNRVKKDL